VLNYDPKNYEETHGGLLLEPGAINGGGAGPGPRPLASTPISPAANSRCLSALCRMIATICSRDAGCIRRCSIATFDLFPLTNVDKVVQKCQIAFLKKIMNLSCLTTIPAIMVD